MLYHALQTLKTAHHSVSLNVMTHTDDVNVQTQLDVFLQTYQTYLEGAIKKVQRRAAHYVCNKHGMVMQYHWPD